MDVNASQRDLFDLTGRVAIVTGGCSGIGQAMALALGRYGARVLLAGRTTSKCEVAEAELRAAGVDAGFLTVDVRYPQDAREMVDEALARWGRLDILVNNAAISPDAPALEMSVEAWREVMSIDLDGAFYCARAAGRVMREAGSGVIINITSLSGMLGYANQAAYAAAKGGLTMLTRVLAVEWAPYGIRVNAIAPTWFYTPMSKHILDDPAKLAEKVKSIPLGRVGTDEDIMGPVVFLASDASRYVTGHILMVDGGKFALLGEW